MHRPREPATEVDVARRVAATRPCPGCGRPHVAGAAALTALVAAAQEPPLLEALEVHPHPVRVRAEPFGQLEGAGRALELAETPRLRRAQARRTGPEDRFKHTVGTVDRPTWWPPTSTAPGQRGRAGNPEAAMSRSPIPWLSPDGAGDGRRCSLEPIANRGLSSDDQGSTNRAQGEPMTNRPLLEIAAQIARIFVVGMSTAAVVLGFVLLVLAIVL